MNIETWKFDNSDDIRFRVDLEGISLSVFFDCVRRAAANHFDADVVTAPKNVGWMVFGDGHLTSFAMELEVIAGTVFVTPLYLDYGVVALPTEEMILILHDAERMLHAPDEVAEALDDLLSEADSKRHAADVDPITGLVDDDGITIEIDLSEIDVEDGVMYTLEGFGGRLSLTPPPAPVDRFDL